jgi:poly(3-hydroxybutyrate) depolymerase
MLYQLYESQRALLSPFSEFASAASKLYSHPLSIFSHSPASTRIAAGLDLAHRLAKEYEKPSFNITALDIDGIQVAVHEHVALTKPFCKLLRFKRFSDEVEVLNRIKDQPTVLVVAPLSGHPARNCAHFTARPQGLHHRLDRRAYGAHRSGTLSPG